MAGNWGNCVALSMTLLSFMTMIAIGELIIYRITLMIYSDFGSFSQYIRSETVLKLLVIRAAIYYLLLVPALSNMRRTYISLANGKSFIGTQWEIRHYGLRFYAKMIFMQTISLIYQAAMLVPLFACAFGVSYYIELCRQHITTRSLLMFMLCLLMAIIMLCVFLYFRIKMRLVPFINVLYPEIGMLDCFILSSRLMRKNIIRYVFFQLSFLHYFLLCVLVFPILVIFPYYYMSVSVLCSSLVNKNAVEDYLHSKES